MMWWSEQGEAERDGAGRRRPSRHRRADRLDGVLDDVLDDLGATPAALDQTDSIMHRLGYERAEPTVARRRRTRRAINRFVLCLAGTAVAFAAFQFYAHGTAVRRPTGPTVPAALQRDLQRQHDRFNRAFESLRRLAPRPGAADSPDAPRLPEPELDRSAIGPVRWI